MLIEGAQGTMLDIDHGTYPYVTSSNCSSGGISTGLGIPGSKLSNIIGKSMKDKKAKEVSIINLEKIKNSICDYFVICSGNSDIQIDSIAENIEKKVYENTNEKPWKKEGEFNKEWLILDFVNVVAHIFLKEKRYHYNLDKLWGDGNNIIEK